MAAVVNFIDVTLRGSASRTVNLPAAQVLLTPTAPGFHVNVSGVSTPGTITFNASLLSLDGAVTFACSGGTLSNVNARSADLAYSDLTGASATVTASVVSNGVTYTGICTISKIQDASGGTGSPGADGAKTAYVNMYQWSVAAPSAPTGTSTFTWASVSNSGYTGSDGWSTAAPANPGTPGLHLFVATVGITATSSTATTTVSYSAANIAGWAQNGANGTNGVQSKAVTVYQWAATIPAGPVGSATLTWSTGAFGSAPSGYSLTPGASPSAGFTLWAAVAQVVDSTASPTTSFNWTSASVSAIGYAGSNGASYVTAYCASSVGSTTTAPNQTSGKTSVPATNSGGLTGSYSSTVPPLTLGQYLYQSDGIYDPATNLVTWSIPYWSSLKVGSLSAISANLGSVNAGNIDIGSGAASWHVDAAGNTWAGAGSYSAAPYRVSSTGGVVMTSASIQDGSGNVILSSNSSLAQQTRINTNLIPRLSSWPASTAAGGAGVGSNTNDNRFLNGEYLYLPNSSGYVGITTGAIGIPANSWYTVSFDAYCTSTSRTLNVDVFGGGIDSTGIAAGLTNVATRYTFTEQMPNSGSAASTVLRVFCVSGGSDVIVSNVKVEFGLQATAWCDNVITKQNVSTFIQSAAIGLALIDTASIGQLSALSAYLGTVDIGPSGHIASGQTDYNVGNGIWIGGSNAPRMSMRTANGNTFLCDPANNVLQMNGGTISNPTITGSPNGFSISVGSDMYSAPAQRVTSVTLGSRTVSVTGGQGALTYSWAALNVSSDAAGNIYLTGANTATVTVRVTGTAGYDTSGQIQCTVTDGAGFSKTATFTADVTFT